MADESTDHGELNEKDKIDQLSHPEVMALFSEKLAEIMKDPLLIGLPSEPTLDEVNSQIALEHGRAIVVNVRQQDESNTVLPVVVIQNATVHDLKKAIQRHISLKLSREGGPNFVSWKHVWKTYWLLFEGQKLTEDHQPLTQSNMFLSHKERKRESEELTVVPKKSSLRRQKALQTEKAALEKMRWKELEETRERAAKLRGEGLASRNSAGVRPMTTLRNPRTTTKIAS